MSQIKFDFNNMFSSAVGARHGVTRGDIDRISGRAAAAQEHLSKVLAGPSQRIALALEWTQLPLQDKKTVAGIQALGSQIANKFDAVLFLGIGGSYLGLKAAQDALCPPYFNEFPSLRKKKPRIYFEGNNLDPETLSVLLRRLNPRKTAVVVISKSGETSETKAAFMMAQAWLKKAVGSRFGRQVFVITDPDSGSLRKYVQSQQKKDALSFCDLPLLKGVGGRFSEFNMGLLHLAIVGVEIQRVLDGARDMAKRCTASQPMENPALLYALLHTILYQKKAKALAILMPFSETLKSTADWYVQLLAESLGKKYGRKIERPAGAGERWSQDYSRVVNLGRTPISARGTNDLHSIQQNNIEGENNKVITFIRVKKFGRDLRIPGKGDLLSGKSYSQLLALAQEATEWALVQESRPNCAIILPEVTAYSWGALLFFFEMAVAYEGELLDVNAFDQPGVEGYKNYMYYKLGKPGLAKEIAEKIRNNPLVKDQRWII